MAFVTFTVLVFVAAVGTLDGKPTNSINDAMTSSARLVKTDSLTGKHISLDKLDFRELGKGDKLHLEIQFDNGWPPLAMHVSRGSVLRKNSVMVVQWGPHGKSVSHSLNEDCYLRGTLGDHEGHVTFNICDRMSGSLHTEGHHYNIKELDTRGDNTSLAETIFHVTRRKHEPENLATMSDNDALTWVETTAKNLVEEEENVHRKNPTTRTKRAVSNRHLTIELVLYLDSNYLEYLYYEKNMDTERIREFIISKWNTVQGVYDQGPKVIGTRVTIALKKIELWWSNPSGYPADHRSDTNRLNFVCENTRETDHYDMKGLYTKDTGKDNWLGAAWLGLVCRVDRNCFLTKSFTENVKIELHEMGHNLGFKHDPDIGDCDPEGGFMGWGYDYRYLACYKRVLKRRIRQRKFNCLLEENVTDQ